MGFFYKILRRAGLAMHKVPKPSSRFQVSKAEQNEVHKHVVKSSTDSPEDRSGWLQYLSRERLAFFHEIVAKCTALGIEWTEGTIADAGCGSGYLMRIIAKEHPSADLVGYDTFDKGLKLAKLMCPSGRFELLAIHDISDQHRLIFCTEVLEHLVDPKTTLQHLFEKTSPGGSIMLTVPNGRYDHLEAGAQREDGTAYWGHINFWSPESWDLFVRESVPYAAEIVSGPIGSDKLFGWIRK